MDVCVFKEMKISSHGDERGHSVKRTDNEKE